MDKLVVNDIDLYKMQFGDYLLFQKIEQIYNKDEKCYYYKIHPPVMCIFLYYESLDMAVEINYIEWIHHKHQFVFDWNNIKRPKIDCVIEWDDQIHILGIWKNKPNWKDMLRAYRLQLELKTINSADIEWD